MKNKKQSLSLLTPKFIIIVSLIVMGGALLGFVGYLLKNPCLFSSELPVNTNSKIKNQIDVWKTHKSFLLGFSIRYPENWKIVNEKESAVSKQAILEFNEKEGIIIWVEECKSFYSPDLHRYETLKESISRHENYIKSYPEFEKDKIQLSDLEVVEFSYKSETNPNLKYFKVITESESNENNLYKITILNPYKDDEYDPIIIRPVA